MDIRELSFDDATNPGIHFYDRLPGATIIAEHSCKKATTAILFPSTSGNQLAEMMNNLKATVQSVAAVGLTSRLGYDFVVEHRAKKARAAKLISTTSQMRVECIAQKEMYAKICKSLTPGSYTEVKCSELVSRFEDRVVELEQRLAVLGVSVPAQGWDGEERTH